MTLLRDDGVSFVLADARGCELLPEGARVSPAPGLSRLPAARGASCNATCAEAGGMACDASQFWCAAALGAQSRCAVRRALTRAAALPGS